ncbi:ionotropic receptor 76b [Leptinotarsa decemlineata]|uniref:ionotropic receptor 76b n=1 Tax=Leptinotarsa decemlineata TaxID=7539 RepID=UPI003D3086EE
MGLIEIVLAGLCLNATCDFEEEQFAYHRSYNQKLTTLANELKKETLTITTFENGELSGYTIENGTIQGTGIAFDIIGILQNKFGFNYTIVLPDEPLFMSVISKRGAKNLLEAKRADIAVAFLPIVQSFRTDITYSTSFDVAEWNVLMNRPKESATGSGLLAPFTTVVWILIIFSVLIVGPIMYLLILIRARFSREDHAVFSLPSCMWFVYGALLKQGSTLSPKSDSSRILFSTWWLFILILTAFYTANLTAFLTLSSFTLPITNPSDIARKNYKWVTNRANGIRDHIFFENQNSMALTTKLVDLIGPDRYYVDLPDLDIVEQYVAKRDMMFIREKTIIRHVMYKDYRLKTMRGVEEEKRCTYVMADFPIKKFPRAFAYAPNFKYAALFDRTIQYVVESGIIQFKLRENLPESEICPLNLGSSERKLRNTDLLLTYVIVGSGLGIATSVFLLEILWRLQKNKYKSRGKFRIFNEAAVSRDCLGEERSPKGAKWLEMNNNMIRGKPLEFPVSSPPPSYQALFLPPFNFSNREGHKKNINGRDYWVIDKTNGLREIIPIRTPSALLFQFSN